jgi:hypothetical protein
MNREQVEKRLEALEAELPKLREEKKALEKREVDLGRILDGHLATIDSLKNDVEAEIGQQKVLQAEIDRLNLELIKASDQPLLKAFSDFVEERLAKLRGPGQQLIPGIVATLTESAGTLAIEPEKPREYKYSDSSTSGRIVSVIAKGKPGRKWEPRDIGDAIEAKWGVGDADRPKLMDDIGRRLPELITAGVLTRSSDSSRHYVYWMPETIRPVGSE